MAPFNILYLHSHDTGRYIQPMGYAVPTPRYQQLAEQGVLFRTCCCAGPTCSPSRAGLLTGQNAHASGMLGLAHRGFSLADYDRHLGRTLKRCGYHTALSGVQHVFNAEHPPSLVYDDVLARRKADGLADIDLASAEAAADFLASPPAEPFFLSVGLLCTHRHWWEQAEAEDSRYLMPPAPLPDTPATRADWAGYLAYARGMDAAAGVVLDALDAAGLAESTLVIATTDHGVAFPDMKCNLTDHGIGVHMILRGPAELADTLRGGTVIDAMVSHLDVFPTLCELLAIAPPPWLEGVSLMPLLTGAADEVRDELFAEVTYHAAYEPQRCIRTKRYKYIRRFGDRDTPILPNCDNGQAKQLWMHASWADRPVPNEMLFDLLLDPQERVNLAGRPDLADLQADLARRLDDWMRRTHDPLLAGPVPAPPGALINTPDQIHPEQPTTRVET